MHPQNTILSSGLAAMRRQVESMVGTVPDENWAQMAQYVKVDSIEKGDFLLRAHTACNYVWFVVNGCVRMYYESAEKLSTVNFVEEGSYCTDCESLYLRQPTNMYIEAIENTDCIAFHYDDIQQMYAQDAQAQQHGRMILEEVMLKIAERNRSLVQYSAEERYEHLLQSRPHLLQRVPLYMIASYLNISPEHLSRIRRAHLRN